LFASRSQRRTSRHPIFPHPLVEKVEATPLSCVESDGKTLFLVDLRTDESPLEPPEEKARKAAEAEVARLRSELAKLKKH